MRRTTWWGLCAALSGCPIDCGEVPRTQPQPCTGEGTVTLSLNITAGEGAITIAPARTACTSFGGTCSWDFPVCTDVTLTASPYSGFTRADWTGCDAVTGLACALELRQARTVSVALKPGG